MLPLVVHINERLNLMFFSDKLIKEIVNGLHINLSPAFMQECN